jgi:molybdenum cofactor synthesis domain-containing protein
VDEAATVTANDASGTSTTTAWTARVVTVSDRVAAGVAQDRSGPLVVALLDEHGIAAHGPVVVPDEGEQVAGAVHAAAHDGIGLLVLTGGTGIGPRDRTPEAVLPLLDRTLPGVGEAMRAAARDRVPTADLSRAFAGTLGSMLVLALPGSPGGVRDGLAVAAPMLPHARHVLAGGDHSAVPQQSSALTPTGAPRTWVVRCEVTEQRIDAAEHACLVQGADAGAVVTFAGVVRDHDRGRAVERLHYEAHPGAADVLATIADEVAARVPAARLAVSHRVGDLRVGDAALVVAVAATHRAEALEACAALVDEVKARLPVWKHQVFADGSEEWVNCA